MLKSYLIPACLLSACSVGSHGSDAESLAQPVVTKVIRASGFNRLTVSGVDNVRVQLGKAFAIRIEGPAEILDQMIVSREADIPGRMDAAKAEFASKAVFAALNTTLRVDRRWKSAREWMASDPVRVTVYIEMPRLEAVDMHSSGSMWIMGVHGKQFMASLGRGMLFLPDLHVGRLALAVGDGSIVANGVANNLDMRLNGSHVIDLRRLSAESATINEEGSGNLFADVRGRATVSFSGSGSADLGPRSHCSVSKREGSGKLRCGSGAK